MDEFDQIINEIDNAETSKSLKYLKKRTANALRNFYDPAYKGIRSKMVRKAKHVVTLIKKKMSQLG